MANITKFTSIASFTKFNSSPVSYPSLQSFQKELSYKQPRHYSETKFKEDLVKLLETWTIEDLIEERIKRMDNNEYQIHSNIEKHREEFFEPFPKNIKKRNFSTAFGHETYPNEAIGILYQGPSWNDNIYP